MQNKRIAVVGSGIAGLSSAWLLSQRHEVTLFEADDRLGGHTHTVDITVEGKRFAVDTGFLVFNDRTYPNLCALFEHLQVESIASDMSFSLSLEKPMLEWAGSTLGTLFGQPRNLIRPDFWRMVSDMIRFNQTSIAWLQSHPDESGPSLGTYLTQNRYSSAFRDWYLLPMAAAIWSCPTAQMLDYPFATFVRFCSNHGLLQIKDRPQWRTVAGGGRAYINKLVASIDRIRLATQVRNLQRIAGEVLLETQHDTLAFDEVVLAGHSDQSLALLGAEATPDERAILATIPYQANRAVLHTDAALLPRDRSLWSAWNYVSGQGNVDAQPVSVSYLINKLQPLPVETPVVLSLNPFRTPDPAQVIAEFDYAHPVFNRAAIDAQGRLAEIQGSQHVWFCGAWTGYGFHEDGLKSALAVSRQLGCTAPWEDVTRVANDLAQAA
jgi:predicted NAD/FAD-binding protein